MSYLHEREKHTEKTLNVGSLISILKKYPPEMKVLITWESTVNELYPEFIYEAYTGALYLDGDYGFYKEDFKKI